MLMFQVYGGYITSLLLSSEESVLKCAAVLSPITDFTLYGTVCVLYVCVFVSLLLTHKCLYTQDSETDIAVKYHRFEMSRLFTSIGIIIKL